MFITIFLKYKEPIRFQLKHFEAIQVKNLYVKYIVNKQYVFKEEKASIYKEDLIDFNAILLHRIFATNEESFFKQLNYPQKNIDLGKNLESVYLVGGEK